MERVKAIRSFPVRRVHLSGGRILDVMGGGHYTLYRHVGDMTPSPYAGAWTLASPQFRAEIERSVSDPASVDAVDPSAARTGTRSTREKVSCR